MGHHDHQFILGTAGHIDHGKTALIKAFTGVDTDRLPEEQKRGITIDIGFAHIEIDNVQFGVVDVPGHERFVRNMLAGAAGIDIALLVVAADDSVMPQTREHLAILNLLGISAGVIAITKCDAVEGSWIDLVEDEIRDLVAGTFLAQAPILRTSARTGTGLPELRSALIQVAASMTSQRERADVDDHFRMAIDRSFVLQGLGTVVTGTISSGQVTVGEEIEWQPQGRTVRVRGLQSHGATCDSVQRGQRAAVHLANVHHAEIKRGDELATCGWLRPTRRLAVMIQYLPENIRALRHRARVRLHLATTETIAIVLLIDRRELAPGDTAVAVLICANPVCPIGGQPFVVRSESPVFTIGGGHVLLTRGRRISRRSPERAAMAARMLDADPAVRIVTALALNGLDPLTLTDVCRETQLRSHEAESWLNSLGREQKVARSPIGWLHAESIAALEDRVLEVLEQLYDDDATSMAGRSIAMSRLHSALPGVHCSILEYALGRLETAGSLARDESGVSLRNREAVLDDAQARLRTQVLSTFERAAFKPPSLMELASDTEAKKSDVDAITRYCAAEGSLIHLGGGMFLHARAHETLMAQLQEYFGQHDTITVSQLRELLGTSRKYAVPICEYLDRQGYTKRRGDERMAGPQLTKPVSSSVDDLTPEPS